MTKIPVYFMPGLAASSSIFERIELPKDTFEMHLLEWFLPNKNESLQSYAKRMAEKVKHDNAVLVGVSFGGVLVQEMAQFLNLKKLIIVSSVKCNAELPRRLKLAKTTKAYKLLPTGLMQDVELLTKYAFGDVLKKKLKLYEQYLHRREKDYLDWAIEQMVCWERVEVDAKVIHIQGDADEVFPVKNIKNFINIKGGTHLMILNRFRWFNQNLPKIILDQQI
ncbi:alpha/beta fold hydrolase [Flavobacterium aquatile]|uniref:Alpha/beta hydrolase n=1 Tax=Flavobacterium aquatile LMG 4008 = ATCC 11947 TaxID=1453498 RepID=A0A095V466_9FLAO|nr:alpha/beta hydrolase [Flavobacterium aquatile]KGD69650.1 alpha/beta hydrolase [Flavobacterium aquatile LMG 4008 = ATCC 11947]OXA67210.1 alpha/beta hydrolase [Flavobacterium aquatile] [Flavobacterium aquatile LMG 4008 = ATCC 11947]GEC77867.1 alpha/beta hydrolase [Flavobacterium aquatile]